jgi:hypothetical protein
MDRESRIGPCDWCRCQACDLEPRRDFEEGHAGPVYRVCGKCVAAEMLRLNDLFLKGSSDPVNPWP